MGISDRRLPLALMMLVLLSICSHCCGMSASMYSGLLTQLLFGQSMTAALTLQAAPHTQLCALALTSPPSVYARTLHALLSIPSQCCLNLVGSGLLTNLLAVNCCLPVPSCCPDRHQPNDLVVVKDSMTHTHASRCAALAACYLSVRFAGWIGVCMQILGARVPTCFLTEPRV